MSSGFKIAIALREAFGVRANLPAQAYREATSLALLSVSVGCLAVSFIGIE
jgi:hypothetical protein